VPTANRDVTSRGGRCASSLRCARHTRKKLLALPCCPHRPDGSYALGSMTKLTCWLDKRRPTGRGESLRTTSLNLENSRRPWLTEFHSAGPKTTVGVLRGPDSFLFCPGNHCQRGQQLLLRLTDSHPLRPNVDLTTLPGLLRDPTLASRRAEPGGTDGYVGITLPTLAVVTGHPTLVPRSKGQPRSAPSPPLGRRCVTEFIQFWTYEGSPVRFFHPDYREKHAMGGPLMTWRGNGK